MDLILRAGIGVAGLTLAITELHTLLMGELTYYPVGIIAGMLMFSWSLLSIFTHGHEVNHA